MHKILKYSLEIIGWLQIIASPLLISSAIASCIYFPNPTEMRLMLALIIALIGLVIGIVWATKIWKTKGTMWYISQVSATPDLDQIEKSKKDLK